MNKPSQIANVKIRQSRERGFADHGWLKSHHTFSFADYYDPAWMGFRTLRVINEDFVEGGQGFGEHPHRDMEIFTYVIDGALRHKDSMGHTSVIKPGQVQKITAGSGIVHSEFNSSAKDKIHLLQIWIVPKQKGLTPSYQENFLPARDDNHPFLLIGSPQGGKNIVQFHQDVFVYRGILSAGKENWFNLKPGRGLWLQIVKGEIKLNGRALTSGDGASVENAAEIVFTAVKDAEFLVFDLA